MSQKFEFVDIEIDGLVRTVTAKYEEPVYGRSVSFKTPNFAMPLAVSPRINVTDIRLELDHLLNEHTRFYVVKIFDIDRSIINRANLMLQQDLNGNYAHQVFRNFFDGNVMILDFASESLEYLKNLAKYSTTHRLPREVIDLSAWLSNKQKNSTPKEFNKVRDNELARFWDQILSNTRTLNDFESRVLDAGVNVYGDIILPFTKMIRTKSDLSDVRKINAEWMKIQEMRYKPLVAYLLLHPSILKEDYIVDAITEYIKSLRGADILVLKIKNLDVTGGSSHAWSRENLKEILKSILEKKRQNKRLLTIALEAGEQFWPFSLQAFDVVSTSTNMYDKETAGGNTKSKGYGKAIDEHSLELVEFERLQREFNKVGFFPCSHDFCQKRIRTMDEEHYFNYEWWVDSRCHNTLVINAWMKEVSEAVINKEAGVAYTRLSNSSLRELILSNYDSGSNL